MKAKFNIYCIAMFLSVQVFAVPVISSITPNTAFKGQTLKVTINGTGTFFMTTTLVNLQNGVDIIKANSFTALSSTKIEATFTIPANAKIGLWAVTVKGFTNGTLTKNNSFIIALPPPPPPPSITSVSPGAFVGAKVKVTITGINTHFMGTSIVNLKFGSAVISANKDYLINPISDTKLEATFYIPYNVNTGLWTVTVEDKLDGIISKNFNFNIPLRTITISPNTAIPGEDVRTIIIGKNYDFALHYMLKKDNVLINSNYFYNHYPDSVIVSFLIPKDAAIGLYDLVGESWKFDDNTTITKVGTFTVLLPTITITPNTTYQSRKGFGVVLTGTNTHFKGTKKIALTNGNGMDSIYSTTLNVNSNTSMSATFNIPVNAKAGLWDLNIMGPDSSPIFGLGGEKEDFDLSKKKCIVINPQPLISTNIPNIPVNQGETVKVVIAGTNTHFTSGNLLAFISQGTSMIIGTNTVAANNISLTTTFNIPANANTGLWNLNVQDLNDDVITKANSFTVNAVSNLSPGIPAGFQKGLVPNNNMILFPNPAKDQFTLKTNFEKNNTLFTLTITNAQGKVVYSLKEAAALGAYQKTIGISDWPMGVYSVNISSPQGSILQKFIKE